jgi:hypothetical protein
MNPPGGRHRVRPEAPEAAGPLAEKTAPLRRAGPREERLHLAASEQALSSL